MEASSAPAQKTILVLICRIVHSCAVNNNSQLHVVTIKKKSNCHHDADGVISRTNYFLEWPLLQHDILHKI